MTRGVSGTSSIFCVKWCTAGGVEFLFFESVLVVLAKLLFWRGGGGGGGLGTGLSFYVVNRIS